MRVALVHDYLSQDGGAERVLEAFHVLWPEAPLFTLFHDRSRANPVFSSWRVHTSFLQKLPGIFGHYRWFLPLMPTATESHDLNNFDVVVSSSSTFAKGVITPPGTVHICYCHTPTRFLWTDMHAYVQELRAPQTVKQILLPILSHLRMWDRLSADRVDFFIANSETVRHRIKKYYGKESVVLHPPVSINQFSPAAQYEEYYLAGGRLVSYKRFDMIVQAFNRLGLPLKIFGIGPEEKRLKKMAKKNIQFLGRVSDEQRAELYRKCKAFLHPHIEDFGITAVEAMASGRPVIAYGEGGALETVVPGVTGIFLKEQTWEHLAGTIIRFDASVFSSATIRKHAEQFAAPLFQEKMRNIVSDVVQKMS